MNQPRRMVILTDGYLNVHTAKTAICTLRYRPEETAALLDRTAAGKTCGEVLGTGGATPIVASLAEAPADANALLIGIAPPGGKLPAAWRPILFEAIDRGMDVIAGLHQLLRDDAQLAEAAARRGVRLIDLRATDFSEVANRQGIREQCLRIHTVGHDCSVGKMVASVELATGLKRRGVDAEFVATGQTGILVAGGGIAVDRVISDFVAGAAERLVLDNQHHQVLLIEGQGSLFHPRYSGVTLSLMHGSMPDGLVAVVEMGRTMVSGMEPLPLPSLERLIEVYETMANLMHPCRVIGVAVNGHRYSDAEVEAECRRIESEVGLPACDVIRHGADRLVDAVLKLKQQLGK